MRKQKSDKENQERQGQKILTPDQCLVDYPIFFSSIKSRK